MADDITWVEPRDQARPAPAGPAPSLAPDGALPGAAPARRRGRAAGVVIALLLGLLAAAGALGIARERGRLATGVSAALALRSPEGLRSYGEARGLREAHEAAVAALLLAASRERIRGINAACEESAWCEPRRNEAQRGIALADALRATVSTIPPHWSGSRGLIFETEIARLAAEREQWVAAAQVDGAAAWKLAVIDSEGAALESARRSAP